MSNCCNGMPAVKQPNQIKEIWVNSLWKNNPAFVQLLGLCPLLATTTGASTALGLGLCTMLVMILSNFVISSFKRFIPDDIRIPIFVLVIASLVTIIQMLINGYAYSLYLSLGIFLPLIVTNCIVIGRVEAFAYKNSVFMSTLDGFFMGLGMCIALVVLGSIRELAGQGTIFKNLNMLFGPDAKNLYITVFHSNNNFLLATLAPGAFLFLGFIVAGKNWINSTLAERAKSKAKQQKLTNINPELVTSTTNSTQL